MDDSTGAANAAEPFSGRSLRTRITPSSPTYVDGRIDGLALLGELVNVIQALLGNDHQPDAFIRSIEEVTFYGPVHAGDVLEIEAAEVDGSERHRVLDIQVRLVATRVPTELATMALPAAVPVCHFRGTFVLPRYDAIVALTTPSDSDPSGSPQN